MSLEKLKNIDSKLSAFNDGNPSNQLGESPQNNQPNANLEGSYSNSQYGNNPAGATFNVIQGPWVDPQGTKWLTVQNSDGTKDSFSYEGFQKGLNEGIIQKTSILKKLKNIDSKLNKISIIPDEPGRDADKLNNEDAKIYLKNLVDDFVDGDYNMELTKSGWIKAFVHDLNEEISTKI